MVHGVWRGSVAVLVALNNRDHPTQPEWDAYCQTSREILAAGHEQVRALAISDGGGPTSRQRAQTAEVVDGRPVRWALISSSRFARSIGTALSWIIGGFKAFAPHEVLQALRYLDVRGDEIAGLLGLVQILDAQMGLTTIAHFDKPELQLE
jgi:hypothetical protein